MAQILFEVSQVSGNVFSALILLQDMFNYFMYILPGLKKLSIRYCPLITPSGILSCLKFRFLRSFEYFDETSVSKSFVRQIVSQNPSLESLSVNLDCPETVVLEEVNKNYARFTKLINLVSVCNAMVFTNFGFSSQVF